MEDQTFPRMSKNYYTKTERSGDTYRVISVQEEHTIHQLVVLEGHAKITHWGGNGRFEFELDGNRYQSEFTPCVCKDIFNGKFFDYSNLFWADLKPGDWKYAVDQPYWQPV